MYCVIAAASQQHTNMAAVSTGALSTQGKGQRLRCLAFTLSLNSTDPSQRKGQAMIPLLTWRRTSCGQVSGPSSCTFSGVSSCFSIPVGTSLFPDTRTQQTSSTVWLSPRCLDPGSWTLPWSTGTEGWEKQKWFIQKNYCIYKTATLWSVMHIRIYSKRTNFLCKSWRKKETKNGWECLSFLMPI